MVKSNSVSKPEIFKGLKTIVEKTASKIEIGLEKVLAKIDGFDEYRFGVPNKNNDSVKNYWESEED